MLPVDGVNAVVTRYPSEEDDDPGEDDDQEENQTLPSAPGVRVPFLDPGLINILFPGPVTLHPQLDLGTASHPPFLLPPSNHHLYINYIYYSIVLQVYE